MCLKKCCGGGLVFLGARKFTPWQSKTYQGSCCFSESAYPWQSYNSLNLIWAQPCAKSTLGGICERWCIKLMVLCICVIYKCRISLEVPAIFSVGLIRLLYSIYACHNILCKRQWHMCLIMNIWVQGALRLQVFLSCMLTNLTDAIAILIIVYTASCCFVVLVRVAVWAKESLIPLLLLYNTGFRLLPGWSYTEQSLNAFWIACRVYW